MRCSAKRGIHQRCNPTAVDKADLVQMTLVGSCAKYCAPLTQVMHVQIGKHRPGARRNLPVLELLEQLKTGQ